MMDMVSTITIKDNEHFELIKAFMEENNISWQEYILEGFYFNEAEYRLTNMYGVIDKDGNPVAVDEDMIQEIADAWGENTDRIFNFDALNDVMSEVLKEHEYDIARE